MYPSRKYCTVQYQSPEGNICYKEEGRLYTCEDRLSWETKESNETLKSYLRQSDVDGFWRKIPDPNENKRKENYDDNLGEKRIDSIKQQDDKDCGNKYKNKYVLGTFTVLEKDGENIHYCNYPWKSFKVGDPPYEPFNSHPQVPHMFICESFLSKDNGDGTWTWIENEVEDFDGEIEDFYKPRNQTESCNYFNLKKFDSVSEEYEKEPFTIQPVCGLNNGVDKQNFREHKNIRGSAR